MADALLSVDELVRLLTSDVAPAVRDRLGEAWDAQEALCRSQGVPVVDAAWMPASDAARALRRPVQTITRWCREGRYPCRRIGGRWEIAADAVTGMLSGNLRQSVKASNDVGRGYHGQR